MAKAGAAISKKEQYPYPSIFGSHKSMVKDNETAALTDRAHPARATLTAWCEYNESKNTKPEGKPCTVFLSDLDDPQKIILEDEYGMYATDRVRLDSMCGDPNRYRESRLGKLFEKKEKKE